MGIEFKYDVYRCLYKMEKCQNVNDKLNMINKTRFCIVVYSNINIHYPTELESHRNKFIDCFCGLKFNSSLDFTNAYQQSSLTLTTVEL